MATGITIDSRETLVDAQVEGLCGNFEDYLAEFNRRPLYGHTLCQHKKTLELRDKLGGVANSIDSDEYLRELRSMLVAWGMNSQGAKLKEYDEFAASVRMFKPFIASLERVGLAQMEEDMGIDGVDVTTRRLLWTILRAMELSQTQSQTVTGSKALHHLLPQLMPPIDGTYTGKFFHYQSSQLRFGSAPDLILRYFGRIAQEVGDLGRYVRTAPWATSESKVVDNAIIGYCRKHRDMPKGINDAIEWGRQRFR